MKTVVDAVNELQGNANNAQYAFLDGRINGFLKEQHPERESLTSFTVHFIDGEEVRFTLPEFNQCVAEMSEAKWIPEKASKPIYTKAMHEAGELPPVGSECLVEYPAGIWTHAKYMGIGLDGCHILSYRSGHVDSLGNLAKFKPIQTEREKAIEDMYDIYERCESEVVKDTLGALYDAGYRKC